MTGIRLKHLPGLTTIESADGVRLGLVIGSGSHSLGYAEPDLRLLGAFETLDQAVAEIERAVVAEAAMAAVAALGG